MDPLLEPSFKPGDIVTSVWDDPYKPEHRARVIRVDTRRGRSLVLEYLHPDGKRGHTFTAWRDDVQLLVEA